MAETIGVHCMGADLVCDASDHRGLSLINTTQMWVVVVVAAVVVVVV